MINLCGHTMSTPDLDVLQAIDFFHKLKLSGVEIICQEEYRCGLTHKSTSSELKEIRRKVDDLGLKVVCLSSYVKDTNCASERARKNAIDDFTREIEIAKALGCTTLRVLAGHESSSSNRSDALGRLVDSLRQIGMIAAQYGLRLNIENHMRTMASSAKDTVEIIKKTGLENVGILYDQANLDFMRQEAYHSAIDEQIPYINHIHVKDFIWEDAKRRAAVVGTGLVRWEAIISRLLDLGYTRYMSLEYETRWYSEQLPSPEVGLRQSIDYIRGLTS